MLVIYTFFAISNHIDIGYIRFQFELPKFLLLIGNALRASDRFFWPVVYLLIIAGICMIVRAYTKRSTLIILGLASLVRIVDTHVGWGALRNRLNIQTQFSETAVLKSPFWSDAAAHYKNIILAPAKNSPTHWKIFGLLAADKHMGTNAVYLARIDEKNLVKMESTLINGQINSNNLYVIEDDFVLYMLSNLNLKKDLLTKIDGFNVLGPNWRECNQCEQEYDLLNLDQFIKPTQRDEPIIFTVNAGLDKRYLLNGWSKFIEDWGVWSEGPESQLILPIPKRGNARRIAFMLRALVGPDHPKQNIKIYINGDWYSDLQLTSMDENIVSIDIPEISKQQGYISIKLMYSNAVSPKQLGTGSDSRLLAIGLRSAFFIKKLNLANWNYGGLGEIQALCSFANSPMFMCGPNFE